MHFRDLSIQKLSESQNTKHWSIFECEIKIKS